MVLCLKARESRSPPGLPIHPSPSPTVPLRIREAIHPGQAGEMDHLCQARCGDRRPGHLRPGIADWPYLLILSWLFALSPLVLPPDIVPDAECAILPLMADPLFLAGAMALLPESWLVLI
jgi:hypothetical protein